MMIKKTLLLLSFIVCYQYSFSQKQTNFWYFGTLAGLDFNSGSPVVMTNGALNTAEGCSTISDASGNLLFYTDGVKVWNKAHTQMPNGFGLLGDPSTSQSALIVPNPGNASLFYIFTLPAEGGGNFCYSVVDMTLQSGKGDVTTKNTFLKSNVTEKMSAVYHCNGHDIWVTIHENGSNSYLAYLVTNTGIDPPVISNVGAKHTDVHGQMKFNTSGTKIACAIDTVITATPLPGTGKGFVDVCDFDRSTGAVSNALRISLTYQRAYGVEFSPDDSKIYVSYYNVAANSGVSQFDLSAANVQTSESIITTSFNPDIYALQLAPNKKIYVTREITPFLDVINSPNLSGAACSYTSNAINLDPNSTGTMCMLGLPNFIQSYLNPSFPTIAPCVTTTVTPPPVAQVDTCGDVFVPTGFSPNNDGQNDLECVLGNCISQLQFSIFDRWGEKVFETTDQRQCWDGTYRGKLMNTGIYVYYLKATLQNGDIVEKKGNINLIR